MLDLILVAIGGFVGANLRFILFNSFARYFGTAFPYGTFFINITGSFLLSFFLALTARAILADEAYRWLFAVGFCGGYTTFSTYTYETLLLLREKRLLTGLIGYLVGSYVVGMLAALLGWWAGSGF